MTKTDNNFDADSITSRIDKKIIYSWLIVLLFISSSLLSQQVSLKDSLSLCLFLTIDVITGATFWMLISKKRKFGVFEIFGTGIVLGTSICTIFQQFLRDTPFNGISPFLFFIATSYIFHRKRQNGWQHPTIDLVSFKSVFLICIITSLARCSENYLNWVVVLILSIGYLFLKLVNRDRQTSATAFSVVVISISIAFALKRYLENLLFGFTDLLSRVSNFDQVFFEANSRGLQNYGPLDNIFLANTKFAYYWFSDAWAGAITAKSGVHEWVVTTEFGLLVATLGSFFLAKAICTNRQYSENQASAVLILIATASLQGNANYAFSSQSFSLVVSVLWIIFVLFMFNETFIERDLTNSLVLLFIIWILVLTKTLVAIPLLLGISLLLLLSLVSKRFASAIIFFVTLFGSFLLYLVFIKPEFSFQGSYSQFSIKPTFIIFEFFTINHWLDILLFIVFELAGLLWLISSKKLFKDTFLSSIFIVLLFSFASALFINIGQNTMGSQYLIIPLLLITPFLIGESFRINFLKSKLIKKYFVFSVSLGLCAGFVSTWGLNYYREKDDLDSLRVTFVRIIPAIVVILVIVLISLKKPLIEKKLKVFQYCIVLLVASGPGSYIAHSLKPFQQVILSKDYWEIKDNSLRIKMAQINQSMEYISSSLSSSDVIASNSLNDFGLIAAMTGARNYASTYTRGLWGNTEIRYENQSSFGSEPSFENYQHLRSGCVTWFYFDKTVSELSRLSWEPFAVIRFEDDFGLVLELSDLSQIPKTCFDS